MKTAKKPARLDDPAVQLEELVRQWRETCVTRNGVAPESEDALRALEPSAACKLLRTAITRLGAIQ